MLRGLLVNGRQIEAEGCGSADGEACVFRYSADVVDKIKPRQANTEGCSGSACVIRYNADVVEKVKPRQVETEGCSGSACVIRYSSDSTDE